MEENNNAKLKNSLDDQFTEEDLKVYVNNAISNAKKDIAELDEEKRELYEATLPKYTLEDRYFKNIGDELSSFTFKNYLEVDSSDIKLDETLVWEVTSPNTDNRGLFKKREEALDYLYSIIRNCDVVEFTLKKLMITKEESEDLFKSEANFVIIPEEAASTDILEAFPNLLKSPLELLIEDACKNLNFFQVDIKNLSLKRLDVVGLTIRRDGTSFLSSPSPQFIVLDENGKRDYANIDNVYMPGDETNGLRVLDYIELVVKYLKQYHLNLVIERQ